MGHRRDEAEHSPGLGDAHVARGAAAAVVEVLEREARGELRSHHRQRQILIDPALIDLAERHHLDQGQIHAASVRPLDQTREFVFVDALERYRVDLDLEARFLRGVDAGEYLAERSPTGNGAEFIGVERIERHVDPTHAVRLDLLRIFPELRAVGGERQLLEAAGAQVARQRGEQRHDFAADQWLAAGEAKLSHAARNERRAKPIEFLERKQVDLRKEGHVLCHAIDAAEIATIGHRDAQIGNRPSERIDQGCPTAVAIQFRRRCAIGQHVIGLTFSIVVPVTRVPMAQAGPWLGYPLTLSNEPPTVKDGAFAKRLTSRHARCVSRDNFGNRLPKQLAACSAEQIYPAFNFVRLHAVELDVCSDRIALPVDGSPMIGSGI